MYKFIIKRIIDIVIALLLIPLFILIIIPVFILIKLEDCGPIFYCGMRLGKGMNEFKMFKFRTMSVNAPDIRNEDGSTYNSGNDPRLTKVGKFLRRTSIDEVPQILNVLNGTMSLIGPRPSPLGNKDKYPDQYFNKFDVLPGITGYNQALLRNESTMEQRIYNDLYYVNHISFLFDCKIAIKTIHIVIKARNINRND